MPTWLKQAGTFLFVTFTWVFFRAESFADARLILAKIADFGLEDPIFPVLMLALVAAVWAYQYLYESRGRWILQPAPVRIGLVVLMICYMAAFGISRGQAFIYFQF